MEMAAFLSILSIIVAGFWFFVAGNLTRRLLDRQRVGAAPILHGQLVTASQPMPPRNPAPTQPAGTTSLATANPTQFVNQTQSPTSMPLSASTEEDFWATAMNEVETGQRRPGVWAKAFAEFDGDETKAKVAYLKARVQQLTDAESTRQAEVAREQERIKTQAGRQIQEAILNFQTGLGPRSADIKLLANAAIQDAKVALITDHVGNNLLHWCALLDLDNEATVLLRHGADAGVPNDDGRQPYQLARGIALKTMLATAAANRPQGTCPNCATVMPLTSQICPKCSAVFEEGAAWKLIPVKNA